MPTGTINVYIASSFLSTASGSANAKIDYPVRPADNIGEGNILGYYTVVAGVSGTQNLDIIFTASSSGTTLSGFNEVLNLSTFKDITSSGVITCLADYAIPATSSGLVKTIDTLYAYNTGAYYVPGFQPTKTEVLIGKSYNYFTSTLLSLKLSEQVDGGYNYVSNYTSPSGLYETKDITTRSTFSGSLITGGAVNAFIDSFFAGYVFHYSPFRIICGIPGTHFGSDFDIELTPGDVKSILTSTMVGLEQYGLFSVFDLYSCTEKEPDILLDIESIDGRIAYLDFELFSGIFNTNSITFDIDLLSLKISDLSLDEGEYINANGTLCVDVTDDIYNVVPSGCYFILDGTIVSGTFSTITDGYRMCYDPTDDFASVLGAVEFQAVALNDNGDILIKSFYLTSGYVVEYDNVDQDYGQGNKIVIRMSAENFASCPAVGAFAYEVETIPKESRDLPCIINGIPDLWHSDLPAAIYPNSTAFFYGKIMKVEIRAKDYAGNEMAPFIFEFRIEDKPN